MFRVVDPTIAAALITAGGGLVIGAGSVIKYFLDRRRMRAAEGAAAEAQKKATQEAEQLRLSRAAQGKFSKAATVYTLEKAEFIVEFDETGSGKSERKWYGLRVTQKLQGLELPLTLRVFGPKATMTDVSANELPESGARVRLEKDPKSTTQVFKGKLVVDAFLTPSTNAVAFCLLQRYSNGFLMTRAEVDDAYKNDVWKSEYISYALPVDDCQQLTLSITFPHSFAGLNPRPYGIVFEAETEVVVADQAERYRDKVTFAGTTATLTIPDPTRGLRYGITWDPPA